MKIRHKATPAVYLLLCRGDEVLLSLRQNTGYEDGNWNLPSGHLEPGEVMSDALDRETLEEVGVADISKCSPLLAHVMYRSSRKEPGDYIDFFYAVDGARLEITNAEPSKCAALGWFRTNGLPENTTPHVRRAIECMAHGIPVSELRE